MPRQHLFRTLLLAAVLTGCGLLPAGTAADAPAATAVPAATPLAAPIAGTAIKPGTQGPFEPWTLQPLAVGNCWTYRWKCPAIPAENGEEISAKTTPLAKVLRRYEFNGKSTSESSDLRKIQVHEEIYMISHKFEQNYFFTVSTNPEISAEQIRDGRFADAVENCWTWWDCRKNGAGSIGLTESIKRNWGKHAKELLGDLPVPTDFPGDHRNAIQVEFKNGTWCSQWVDLAPQGSSCRFTYKTTDGEMEVPAGRFKVNLETSEKVYLDGSDTSPLQWETHAWWSRGVGKIREQQKLADGTVTYELELLRFSLAEEPPVPPPPQP